MATLTPSSAGNPSYLKLPLLFIICLLSFCLLVAVSVYITSRMQDNYIYINISKIQAIEHKKARFARNY